MWVCVQYTYLLGNTGSIKAQVPVGLRNFVELYGKLVLANIRTKLNCSKNIIADLD